MVLGSIKRGNFHGVWIIAKLFEGKNKILENEAYFRSLYCYRFYFLH